MPLISDLRSSPPSEKSVTIYALIDPRDQTPFYVGATSRKPSLRLSLHLHDALNSQFKSAKCDRIRAIAGAGLRTEILDLETVKYLDWIEAEQFWIANLRFMGAQLTNSGIGGPGALGARQTPAIQKRRSEAAKGRDMSHTHTPEVRELAVRTMRHAIEIDGVVYAGIKRAAVSTGIPYTTIQHWLKRGSRARRITA